MLSLIIETAKEAGKDPQALVELFWQTVGPVVQSGAAGNEVDRAIESFLLTHVASPTGPCCQCGRTHALGRCPPDGRGTFDAQTGEIDFGDGTLMLDAGADVELHLYGRVSAETLERARSDGFRIINAE